MFYCYYKKEIYIEKRKSVYVCLANMVMIKLESQGASTQELGGVLPSADRLTYARSPQARVLKIAVWPQQQTQQLRIPARVATHPGFTPKVSFWCLCPAAI